MAQPTAYNRAYNFSNYQAQHPADPLPGGSLDEELSRVKVTLDQIRANLALIQRDDTAVANRSVGFDQLKTEVSIGINPPAPWETAHAYVVRDTVFSNSSFYICETSHVSGVFATDLAAGKWSLIASFEAATSAASVTFDDSTAQLDASTVQAAIEAVVVDVATFTATVSALALVASTADYGDLINTPVLAAVATSGSYADLVDAVTLGDSASLDVGTTTGTVAAGDDSRITGALSSASTITDALVGGIRNPSNQTYMLALKVPFGFTISETTTKCESGSCTATFKINTTALGGTANAVSTTEQSQAQASANVGVAGDDIQVTISDNSSCVGLSFRVKFTRALS